LVKAPVAVKDWRAHVQQLYSATMLFEPVNTDDDSKPINDYDVMAIEHAFRKWGHLWSHATVIIHIDSTTAYSGVVDGTPKASAMDALRQTLLMAATADTSLQCR
jgi:hypothetical protein